MNDKQRKRLMIASILGVISIGITSLSFSYAWYASSSRVEISGVDIYIRSERNLRISPTIEGEYKNDLLYEELSESGMFDPCSSMYSTKWMSEKKDNPEFYRYDMPIVDQTTGEPRYSIAKKGLYTQELFLKVDDDAYVTLDKEMLIIDENVNKNIERAKHIASQYPEYTQDELVERLNSLKKCLRVSILVPDENDYQYYIIDPYKEGITSYGGRLDLEKTGYYSYYVHNEVLYETVFGEVKNRDKIIYGDKLDLDSELIGEETSFNARSKKGVCPYKVDESLSNGVEIAKEDSIMPEEIEERIMIPLKHEEPKRIVLSIYMEGWDLDCTNAHMGGSFDLGLGFKILREM